MPDLIHLPHQHSGTAPHCNAHGNQHSIEYPEILRIKFSWNLVCGVFITCQASNLRHGHIASACNQDQPLLIAGKQVLQARHRRLPQG